MAFMAAYLKNFTPIKLLKNKCKVNSLMKNYAITACLVKSKLISSQLNRISMKCGTAHKQGEEKPYGCLTRGRMAPY